MLRSCALAHSADTRLMLARWLLCRASTLKRREERKRKREEQEAAEKAAATAKEKEKVAGEADAPAEAPAAEDGNGPAKRAKVEAVGDAAPGANGSAATDGTAAQEALATTGSKPEGKHATEQNAHEEPAVAEAVKTEVAAGPLKTEQDVKGAEPAAEALAASDVKMAEAEPQAAPADGAVQAVADANGAYLPAKRYAGCEPAYDLDSSA